MQRGSVVYVSCCNRFLSEILFLPKLYKCIFIPFLGSGVWGGGEGVSRVLYILKIIFKKDAGIDVWVFLMVN